MSENIPPYMKDDYSKWISDIAASNVGVSSGGMGINTTIPHQYPSTYSINNPGNVSGTITNSSVRTYDYTIRGQTFHASFEMSSFEKMNNVWDEVSIKKMLCERLVEEMMKSNHIEFTRQETNFGDSYTFRARIFAVPDNQVRILRSLKEIQ